jgi:hypothetical protein
MSLLSRLFGSRPAAEPPPAPAEEHKGFRIVPRPIPEGGTYRVAARIEKEVGGQTRAHDLVRADTMASLDEAKALSVAKARQMIDEQGERLFG